MPDYYLDVSVTLTTFTPVAIPRISGTPPYELAPAVTLVTLTPVVTPAIQTVDVYEPNPQVTLTTFTPIVTPVVRDNLIQLTVNVILNTFTPAVIPIISDGVIEIAAAVLLETFTPEVIPVISGAPSYRLFGKTLGELVSMTLLAANDPNGERHAHSRVAEALNEVMLELALRVKLIYEEVSIAVEAGTATYDLHAIIAAAGMQRECAMIQRIVYDDGGNLPVLKPTTFPFKDRAGFYPSEIGTEREWRSDMVPHGHFTLVPIPATGGASLSYDYPVDENGNPIGIDESGTGFISGEVPEAEPGNVIVNYVALPRYMDTDESMPDTLQDMFHAALSVGAAARLLDEGDSDDIKIAAMLDREFYGWMMQVKGEISRGITSYYDMRPM